MELLKLSPIGRGEMKKQFKIIVEKHADGYVAYPLGLKGVVIGEGNTYDEALADVKSAISSHIETFGSDVFEGESSVLGAFVAEAAISHDPMLITGKRANAVLVSEDDWRSIQETLYLLSVPGMRESILDGLNTPVDECSREVDW